MDKGAAGQYQAEEALCQLLLLLGSAGEGGWPGKLQAPSGVCAGEGDRPGAGDDQPAAASGGGAGGDREHETGPESLTVLGYFRVDSKIQEY